MSYGNEIWEFHRFDIRRSDIKDKFRYNLTIQTNRKFKSFGGSDLRKTIKPEEALICIIRVHFPQSKVNARAKIYAIQYK